MANSEAITAESTLRASAGVRYSQLDSLRGVAALTVVFHHFRLMWFGYGHGQNWWLRLVTPVTAGHEAVMLFFMLSGFVLSIPYLRGKAQPYPLYLARRVLRIYGPYFFALILAVAGAAIWHGTLPRDAWANMTWDQPVHRKLLLQHVLMIGNYDEVEYNTAFWSLVVEMRVSILFPLIFWLVNRMRTWTALSATLLGTVAMTLIIARHQDHVLTLNTLLFGLIFVCGIVLAKQVERVNAWYRALRPGNRVMFAVASFLLYTWGFRIAMVVHRDFGQDQVLITLGAAGYIILALNAGWAKRALGTRVARFLGRISYSLYLVHGTVLFALTHALGYRVPMMVQLVLYVGISIGLGYLLCVVVEEQFLRLSRMVGKKRLVLTEPFGSA